MTLISGGTFIEQILATTQLAVNPNEFVLVGIEPSHRAQLEASLSGLAGHFFQYTAETDVLTLLLMRQDWTTIKEDYPEANVEGPLRLFTFSVAMDWEVVGFLAAVTSLLAQAGIPLGAVCGYYRDHLFIARKYAHQAQNLLLAEIERCKSATA